MRFFRRKSKEEENKPEADAQLESQEGAGAEAATDGGPEAPEEEAAAEPVDAPQVLEPITPQKRKRLQTCYVVGKKNFDTGNYDYAVQMFQQCVVQDPCNLEYLKSMLENLHRKYDNNGKGSPGASLRGAGYKSSMKKCRGKGDWLGVIRAGAAMLALNPWDASTLCNMAEACEKLDCDDCELFYLKSALNTSPKDPKLNRLAALALERFGDFSQAITCWHRVEEARPSDEEALKKISDLTIQRTMPRSQAEKQQAAAQAERRRQEAKQSGEDVESQRELTREERLIERIKEEPESKLPYVDLAEFYLGDNKYKEAEKVFSKALEVTGGGDLEIRARLEDCRMLRAFRQWEVAEQRAENEGTEEAKKLAKRMKAELNHVEMEIYAKRCEENSSNADYRYELGVRLKRAGKFKEAITNLQHATGEGKRRAAVHLELGECFQYIKQQRLAMSNYAKAIEYGREKDLDTLKRALYRAGVLATGMKEWDDAERRLTELAGLDFGFRDVAERLDKLSQMRDDG